MTSNRLQSNDQVVRREELERLFPGRVTFSCVDRVHRATVRQGGSVYEVANSQLRAVVDRALEILLSK